MDVVHLYVQYSENVSAEETIKLTMTGKLSYDDDITVVQAAQIISYLYSGAAAVAPPGAAPPLPPFTTGKGDQPNGSAAPEPKRGGLSLRDALTSSGAKTNPEKIVAFALHVGQQGDKDTFTIEDIKPLFRQARETTPRNLSRDLDVAIRANWIASSDEKSEYYVTELASDVLQAGFDSIRNVAAKSKSSPSRRVRKTSIPMPESFKGIEITPTIDGYINYHKVKTKTDKYLWAINAAKLWGVEALSNIEIVWLTDRLGVCLPSSDLNAYYKPNFKAGYVNRNSADKVRVLPAGMDHLIALKAGVGE